MNGFVGDLQCLGATRFFKIGGHASDGIKFEVGMAAAAQLFGCFNGVGCMLGQAS